MQESLHIALTPIIIPIYSDIPNKHTRNPRALRGAISAKYVGATIPACPIPSPMTNRPPYTWPKVPWAVIIMITPASHKTQSWRMDQSIPIRSQRTKAIKAPDTQPMCTIEVMFESRSACSEASRKLARRSNSRMNDCWATVVEIRPSSRPAS